MNENQKNQFLSILKSRKEASLPQYITDENPLVDSFDEDRLVLKNLLSSTGDVSKYRSSKNDKLRFERDEDGRIFSYEEGSNKRYAIDPEGFDLGDIGDLGYDALKTGGEIAGGTLGGLAGGLTSFGAGAPVGAALGAASAGSGLEALRQKLGERFGISNNTDNIAQDAIIDGAFSLGVPAAGAAIGKGAKAALKSRLAERAINRARIAAPKAKASLKEKVLKTVAPQDSKVLDRYLQDQNYRNLVQRIDDEGALALQNVNEDFGKQAKKAIKKEEQRIWKEEMLPTREGMDDVSALNLQRSVNEEVSKLADEDIPRGIINKITDIQEVVNKSYLSPDEALRLKNKLWALKNKGEGLQRSQGYSGNEVALFATRVNDALDKQIKKAVKDPVAYTNANKMYSRLKNLETNQGTNSTKRFSTGKDTMNTLSKLGKGANNGADINALSAVQFAEEAAKRNNMQLSADEMNLLNRGVMQMGKNLSGPMVNKQLANTAGDAAGTAAFALTRSFWPAKLLNKMSAGKIENLSKTENVLKSIDEIINLRKAGKGITKSTRRGLDAASDKVEKIFLPNETFSPYLGRVPRKDRIMYNFMNEDDE